MCYVGANKRRKTDDSRRVKNIKKDLSVELTVNFRIRKHKSSSQGRSSIGSSIMNTMAPIKQEWSDTGQTKQMIN